MPNHIVLLGDSIFDNKAYVGAGPAVIEQLRARLPAGDRATLLAVDGSVTAGVARQLARLPAGATHLVVSAGGNDALGESHLLEMPARSAAEVFDAVADARERFAADYRAMLDAVQARGLSTVVCTVYDGNMPDRQRQRLASAGLAAFNDIITREAVLRRLPIIDLRVLFNDPRDYANPIEPSPAGGVKIVTLVGLIVSRHDFAASRAVFYA